MVTEADIWDLLKINFAFSGPVDIDADGQVSATGVDALNKNFRTVDGKLTSTLPVKFGYVRRHFNVSQSNLKSLEGCPYTVEGSFKCQENKLTSLEGGPTEVFGAYVCSDNPLRTLQGAPVHIRGEFLLLDTNITNFIGGPKKVDGIMVAIRNPNLRSLEGFPVDVPHVALDWREDMPLLRTLVANNLSLASIEFPSKATEVINIMKPFLGQGKRAMFDCQKELEDAGFEGNAKW